MAETTSNAATRPNGAPKRRNDRKGSGATIADRPDERIEVALHAVWQIDVLCHDLLGHAARIDSDGKDAPSSDQTAAVILAFATRASALAIAAAACLNEDDASEATIEELREVLHGQA